ncbi:MAG: hypothetical protein FD155_196 [Bacteroidetes bacterium]|nr:MAG: hypothetical protein FD155_196 [Bacteroidota bacterium]
MKKDKFGFEGSSIILWNKKVSIIWIILIGIVIHFVIVVIGNEIDNNDLKKNGIETSAIVTDVRKVGSKGVIRCTYTFEVNNLIYTGNVDDDYYEIGDTIQVLYLKRIPEINRDKKFLEKIND